jgi:hypothetical protein
LGPKKGSKNKNLGRQESERFTQGSYFRGGGVHRNIGVRHLWDKGELSENLKETVYTKNSKLMSDFLYQFQPPPSSAIEGWIDLRFSMFFFPWANFSSFVFFFERSSTLSANSCCAAA